MSYQVLARKWRPRRFDELVGQEHVVRALSSALDSERTHHAYLFTGTRGVGKTTIARIFAKSLNCERGESAEPCGECSVCKAVDEGRFVDLVEIDAASNTSVDDVRDVIEKAQYAPAQGRYKVYLVDEVHMLSRSAFNALLKTLEEPPPHVKFLLATTDPQKLPATVLSRCLRFNLKRLLPEQIGGQIRHILEAEGIEYEDSAVDELARAADGSLRDGLSLLDQAIAYGGGKLTGGEVRSMLGVVERDRLVALVEALRDGDGDALVTGCAAMAEFSPDYGHVLDDLASLLHRIQLHQLVPGYVDDAPDAAPVTTLAQALSAEEVQLYYQLALTGQRELEQAPSMQLGFEMTLLRMLAFRPDSAASIPAGRQSQSAGKAKAPVGMAPGKAPGVGKAPAPPSHDRSVAATDPLVTRHQQVSAPSPKPAPVEAPRKAPTDAVPPTAKPAPTTTAPASTAVPPLAVKPGTLPDWEALIARAGLHGLMHELAIHASIKSLDDNELTLALPSTYASLAIEPMLGQMQDKLGDALGRRLKLHFVTVDDTIDTPASREKAASDARQAEAERAIAEDPFVQSMQQTLGATVIPESIRPSQPESPPESH